MAVADSLDDFECVICCDILDDPRLLPCGHMFCGPKKGCVNAMRKSANSVDCPSCRKSHQIDVNSLQPIYVLRSFLENQKFVASKSEAAATNLAHSGDVAQCEKHSEQELKYFCEDCQVKACEFCWGNDHGGHIVVLLKVRLRKKVIEAIEGSNIDELLGVYDKAVVDNKKRRQWILEILTEVDVVNQMLVGRKNNLTGLKTRCESYKSSATSTDDDAHQLLDDLKQALDGESDKDILKTLSEISEAGKKKLVKFSNLFSETEVVFSNLTKSGEKKPVKPKKTSDAGSSVVSENTAVKPKDKKQHATSSLEAKMNEMCNVSGPNSTSRVSSVADAVLGPTGDQNASEEEEYSSGSEASGAASTPSAPTSRPGSAQRGKAKTRKNKVAVARGGQHKATSLVGNPVHRPQMFRQPPPLLTGNATGVPGFNRAAFQRFPSGPQRFPNQNSNQRFPVGSFRPPINLMNAPTYTQPPPLRPNATVADEILGISGCMVSVRGEIFNSKNSIAYTVSEELVFSYGLANEIARRFKPIPEICRKAKRAPGEICVFADNRTTPVRYIYSLITQCQGQHKSTYNSLERALSTMREHAKKNNVNTVCVPHMMGCSPEEGLSWSSVELFIDATFNGSGINVFIYQKPL